MSSPRPPTADGDSDVAKWLQTTTSATRASPSDASLRMQLFRLFAVTGQWDRALNQLDTASNLDTNLGFTVTVYKQAIACELLRAEVFAGRRTPVVAGEPSPWLALMVEAMRGGRTAAVAALRSQALDQAPAVGGELNAKRFEWIADADARLGPIVEAFIDGKYFWVPFDRITELKTGVPDDLLDKVWIGAEMTFTAGGTKHVLLPVRYVGTEQRDDDALRLAGSTIWEGSEDLGYCGVGQRCWTTDQDEVGLLDVRTLTLSPSRDNDG